MSSLRMERLERLNLFDRLDRLSGRIYSTVDRRLPCRGMSLIESIIAMSVLTLLIFIATDAAVHTLRVAALTGGRASSARTVSELASRMAEEARSSTAVFIPANDVLGDTNAGAAAHEVDFFRRLSAGGDSYVAYLL